ncbi:MAG: hypothetical protein KJT03_04810 [Verrucomicrobiae bacterium]|nr:hypothetical protein [Verrucomicrobiae bacterium]
MSFILIGILTLPFSRISGSEGQPAGWPEYSWDTVPLYIHFGKFDGLTDEEVRFVASHADLVCLEKGHGRNPHGSSEAGIEHDTLRLKKVNPELRVLYYWNTFLDYPLYDAHDVYDRHPEWWLRTVDGSLDKKGGTIRRYDLSLPEVREWWAEEVRKAVVDRTCDGVFADAFPQIASRGNIRLWGQEKFQAIQDGLIQTMQLTRQKIGHEGIILFNGIRNTDTLHFGMDYLDVVDAVTIEHFDQFQSRSRESMAQDIEDMITAGKQGKMIMFKGWPGFNWTEETIRDVPYETLLVRARENIIFPLACFLVGAQEYAYFCYSWGYRENHGSLDWYEEFDKPLGTPQGDAVRDDWTYARQFENCLVWVDLQNHEARLDWK